MVAIGEQGLNSFAVAVSFGDDGTLVGGLLAGLDGAAGGAGGSAKLGTKAGAAALGTKALAEACVCIEVWIFGARAAAESRAVRALLAASSASRPAAAPVGAGGRSAAAA